MTIVRNFKAELAFSKGVVAATCEATLLAMIPGAERVEKTKLEEDLSGIDYKVHLDSGVVVNIDHKARRAGCARYWMHGPEISLEVWSVKPKGRADGKIGWTLDSAKQTHYTFHTFDPVDWILAYLFPFQLLRMTFKRCGRDWYSQYKHDVQDSGAWKSECLFVPVSVLEYELTRTQRTSLKGATA